MVVLGSPEIDVSGPNLHSIEEAKSILSTCIISVLAEPVALRVLFASFLDEMEALQAAIAL